MKRKMHEISSRKLFLNLNEKNQILRSSSHTNPHPTKLQTSPHHTTEKETKTQQNPRKFGEIFIFIFEVASRSEVFTFRHICGKASPLAHGKIVNERKIWNCTFMKIWCSLKSLIPFGAFVCVHMNHADAITKLGCFGGRHRKFCTRNFTNFSPVYCVASMNGKKFGNGTDSKLVALCFGFLHADLQLNKY